MELRYVVSHAEVILQHAKNRINAGDRTECYEYLGELHGFLSEAFGFRAPIECESEESSEPSTMWEHLH